MTKSNSTKPEPKKSLLALNFFLTNCKKFIASSEIIELKKFIAKYAEQTTFSTEELSNYLEAFLEVINYTISNDLQDVLELLLKGHNANHSFAQLDEFLSGRGASLLVEAIKSDSDNCFKYLVTEAECDVNSIDKSSNQSVL